MTNFNEKQCHYSTNITQIELAAALESIRLRYHSLGFNPSFIHPHSYVRGSEISSPACCLSLAAPRNQGSNRGSSQIDHLPKLAPVLDSR